MKVSVEPTEWVKLAVCGTGIEQVEAPLGPIALTDFLCHQSDAIRTAREGFFRWFTC